MGFTNYELDSRLTSGFSTIWKGKYMNDMYLPLLDKLPKEGWFRCMEVDENDYVMVGKLMKALVSIGKAEKRTVDDGIIKVPDTKWVIDDITEPIEIEAFDKNGNSLGMVSNPKYREQFIKYGGKNGHWEPTTRDIHTFHSEYRLI